MNLSDKFLEQRNTAKVKYKAGKDYSTLEVLVILANEAKER